MIASMISLFVGGLILMSRSSAASCISIGCRGGSLLRTSLKCSIHLSSCSWWLLVLKLQWPASPGRLSYLSLLAFSPVCWSFCTELLVSVSALVISCHLLSFSALSFPSDFPCFHFDPLFPQFSPMSNYIIYAGSQEHPTHTPPHTCTVCRRPVVDPESAHLTSLTPKMLRL